jgi:hypothetical protein
MVNRRAQLKGLRSLLRLMVLALSSAAVWGCAPEDARAQDVGPGLPSWCLLPRTPFSAVLWTDDTQHVAEPTEDQAVALGHGEGAKPSETWSASTFAVSQPAPVRCSQAVRPEGQTPAQGSCSSQTTDQGPQLMIPSTVVWQRALQAITALRTELQFPSLLPRTPLSPALWTQDAQRVSVQRGDQAAGSPQEGGSKPSGTGSGSGFAPSRPAPVPPSQAVGPNGQPLAQGYSGPQATDQGPPLMIPSTEVWQRVSQAITILHIEPAFPSLLPRPQVSPEVWTHDAQRAVQQAKKEEKGKKETGETAAAQPPPVLLATGMAPGGQPPAQSQNESLTKGQAGTAPASPKAPALAPGEKGGTAPNQAGNSASSEMTTGQSPQRPDGKRQKGETPASQVTPVHPSSVARQKGQPTVQGYHGPGAADRAGAVAIQASAGEFSNTAGGGRALRDPFKLPPPPRPDQEEKDDPKLPGNRPPGSRGLLVEQLRLKGVVRDGATQKMIAVVTTNNNRAYFLREGEAVYDGVVSKITSDAVYFKGSIFDAKREARSREVVKTLSPAPGEVR